ncbi:MAG: M24 family metallopeptidase [Bacteroidetes bacterium]|jgi:Xaa-Pro aminopeptidase|nr:M24 family metallopeptidase [Bacteroidota bacterium]
MSFLSTVGASLKEHDADAALISFLPDIRWACGFTGSNGLLFVRRAAEAAGLEAHFVTDGRYTVQAQEEVTEATVHVPGYQLFPYLVKEGFFDGIERLLFQADHVSVAQRDTWAGQTADVRWIGAQEILTRAVAQKTAQEIEHIRAAQLITEEVFSFLLQHIQPGVTEREVAAQIVYQHINRGADKLSFDPIVAAGPRGALPHARPTDRPIASGELVVIDMGCFLNGYASDMTRTVAVGEPGKEARNVYATVRRAQEAAIEVARAGISSDALDAVARDVIEEAGYGDFFSHGLGHGLGLQVHEWPRLSYHVSYPLPADAAVTIEPGIYLPERFGVRIEDIVVLRDSSCVNLTTAPKNLIVID